MRLKLALGLDVSKIGAADNGRNDFNQLLLLINDRKVEFCLFNLPVEFCITSNSGSINYFNK